LVHFSGFGIKHHEKSGNPEVTTSAAIGFRGNEDLRKKFNTSFRNLIDFQSLNCYLKAHTQRVGYVIFQSTELLKYFASVEI
jgi:hypothetical protein